MYFQKVLKGIKGLSPGEATVMVGEDGIHCNWWRREGTVSPGEIRDQLTDSNVLYHLNHYDDPLPVSHPHYSPTEKLTYGDITPFISTTAGTVQRFASPGFNICFPAFMTALQFATANFTEKGYIFYAWLITLGKKALPLMQFAEEVRELQSHRQLVPYHHDGEIVAKIVIPSPQIERAEQYDGPEALAALLTGRFPTPVATIRNGHYAPPDTYSNIREIC